MGNTKILEGVGFSPMLYRLHERIDLTDDDDDAVNTYLSYPSSKKTEVAILYLTDVFGLPLVNNRLLGDSLAKAGYFVVM